MDAVEQPKTCPEGTGRYVWRQGDTLSGVAQRYGVTVSALRRANEGRSLDKLKEGDTLCVPDAPTICPSGRLYTVKKGDTIYDIARRYGFTSEAVMAQNPYVDPLKLQIGQVLCLPEDDPPEDTQPCPAGCVQETVHYGDTLASILIRYGMSYEAFLKVNPRFKGARIVPGAHYFVPDAQDRGGCAGARLYQLQSGEGLEQAAKACGVTPLALLICNKNLAPGDFVPGRMISVPDQEKAR